jgi:purine-binding chemotaxis protein CheW
MENSDSKAVQVGGSLGEVTSRYLNFSLGGEDYAIPLSTVREVIAMPKVTPIPDTPAHFLGMMDLRGQVISVIDLRKKMNIRPAANAETTVIICDFATQSIGVVVDAVNAVLSPGLGEIAEKPMVQNLKSSEYITGVYRKENKLIIFIDIAGILDIHDRAMAANAGVVSSSAKKAA